MSHQTTLHKWLTWNKLVIIVLALLILGIALGLVITAQIGLFAPPLLPYTIPIYFLAWLPVLIAGLLLRPAGKPTPAIPVLIVFGLVISVIGLALLGPIFNYTSGSCQLAPLPDEPVRYECLTPVNYQGAQTIYVLVGRENWPFVWAQNR